MTLEEIKNALVAEVEKLWHELTGTVDVEKARQVIADSAATLTGHVSALGQHLFDHVLGNAELPDDAPGISASAEAAPVEFATGGTVSGPGPVIVGESGPETLVLPPAAEAPIETTSESGPVA